MTTITNASAPTVVSFEVLLAKMEPHFKFFAKRVLKLKADNLDDALQELRALAFGIYRSLVHRGKEVFYSPIMKFAIKHYNSGRRLPVQTRPMFLQTVHAFSNDATFVVWISSISMMATYLSSRIGGSPMLQMPYSSRLTSRTGTIANHRETSRSLTTLR